MLPLVKSGTYTGTGAAQTITIGFKPECVLVYNQTDHDTACGFINGMTADTGFTIVGAVATIASAGFTLVPGGFSLGSGADANENTKVYLYVAFGNANLDYNGA